MPSLTDFINDAGSFASLYAIILTEPQRLLHPPLAAGTDHAIAPHNLHFTFSNMASMPQTAICQILNTATTASEPCYFLPYQDDTSVTTTIGTTHRFFFTSQLTGCSVQVSGPRNSPTITHANAKNVFRTNTGGLDAATVAAQNALNIMMPAPVPGSTSASVTRLTMQAAYTPGNVATAKQNYAVTPGYRVKEFNPGMATTHGTPRPELGMVVFGVREPAGWEFFSSTTVSVTGRQKKGKSYLGFHKGVDNKTINDSITLGPASRFWP